MHLRLGSSLAPPETRGFLGISPSLVTQTPQRKLHFINSKFADTLMHCVLQIADSYNS